MYSGPMPEHWDDNKPNGNIELSAADTQSYRERNKPRPDAAFENVDTFSHIDPAAKRVLLLSIITFFNGVQVTTCTLGYTMFTSRVRCQVVSVKYTDS